MPHRSTIIPFAVAVLLASPVAPALSAQAPPAEPPASEAAAPGAATATTPAAAPGVPREVGSYAGEGPHGLLVISPRTMGERRVLVLTDLGTGAIRALFPANAAAAEGGSAASTAAEPSW